MDRQERSLAARCAHKDTLAMITSVLQAVQGFLLFFFQLLLALPAHKAPERQRARLASNACNPAPGLATQKSI